jgi:hypothetical protein
VSQVFPVVKFVALPGYSRKWAEALGNVYTDEIHSRENEVAVLYQKWWDKSKSIIFDDLKERLGISMNGGVIPCYIVTFLPNNRPFSPPTTIDYLFDEVSKKVEIKLWTALHELIHYFEEFDEDVYEKRIEVAKKITDKYPGLETKIMWHFVTSLIEEPIMLNVFKGKMFTKFPYRKTIYPESYKFVESLTPNYESGNVFDYLNRIL